MSPQNTLFETRRFNHLKEELRTARGGVVIVVDVTSTNRRRLLKALDDLLDDPENKTLVLIRVDGFMWSWVVAKLREGIFESVHHNSFGLPPKTSLLNWIQDNVRARGFRVRPPRIGPTVVEPGSTVETLIPALFRDIVGANLERPPEALKRDARTAVAIHEYTLEKHDSRVYSTSRVVDDFLDEWRRFGVLTVEEVAFCLRLDANFGIVLFCPRFSAVALGRKDVDRGLYDVLFLKSTDNVPQSLLYNAIVAYLGTNVEVSVNGDRMIDVGVNDDREGGGDTLRALVPLTEYDPPDSLQSNTWTDQNTLELFMVNSGVPLSVRSQALRFVKYFPVFTHVLSKSNERGVAVYYVTERPETTKTETHVLYVGAQHGSSGDRERIIQLLLALVFRERPLNIFHGKLSSSVLAMGVKLLNFGNEGGMSLGWDLTDPEQFDWLDTKISRIDVSPKLKYYCKEDKLSPDQRKARGYHTEEATTDVCMQQGFGGGLRSMMV